MAVVPALADAFVIEGGRPLRGRIRAAGNKNGALPILAACLLTGEPVTLSNVPRIRDVDTMVELFGDLGGDASWTGANELYVNAAGASKFAPDVGLCSKMRASFLLAGPLLSRFGRATMPPPGGDVIGRRRLDRRCASEGSRVDRSRPDEARRARRDRRGQRARPVAPAARRAGRSRRHGAEARGRTMARVPVRPDLDRGDGRDAGVRHGAYVREDVREPPVLHGQARLDGRADHPVRSAPCRRDGAVNGDQSPLEKG